MFEGLWEYVTLVLKLWGRRISGPVLAVIGLALIGAQQIITDVPTASRISDLGSKVTLSAAGAMILWAMYEAWRDERRTLQNEMAKNTRPEIRGEVSNFAQGGMSGEGHDRGNWHCDIQVEADIFLCNHRPTRTTVRELVLDGSMLNPPVSFEVTSILNRPTGVDVFQALPFDAVLEQGIGQTVVVNANATIRGFRWGEIADRIPLDNLCVEVIDSFGNHHHIAVAHGESLPRP